MFPQRLTLKFPNSHIVPTPWELCRDLWESAFRYRARLRGDVFSNFSGSRRCLPLEIGYVIFCGWWSGCGWVFAGNGFVSGWGMAGKKSKRIPLRRWCLSKFASLVVSMPAPIFAQWHPMPLGRYWAERGSIGILRLFQNGGLPLAHLDLEAWLFSRMGRGHAAAWLDVFHDECAIACPGA